MREEGAKGAVVYRVFHFASGLWNRLLISNISLISAGVAFYAMLAVFPGLYHGADSFVPEAAISRRLQRSFLTALGDALR